MSTPTTFSVFNQLRAFLTRRQKILCLGVLAFAIIVSLLEVVTAGFVVIFARILNDPTLGYHTLKKLPWVADLSVPRLMFVVAAICGLSYAIKNLFAAGEVLFQNFTSSRIGNHIKSKLLALYAEADYGIYLTRDSAVGEQILGECGEALVTRGMLPLASVISETVVLILLIAAVVMLKPLLALIFFGLGSFFVLLFAKGVIPRLYAWAKRLRAANLSSHKQYQSFFKAYKEIILSNNVQAYLNDYKKYSEDATRFQALAAVTNALPRLVIEVVFVALFVLSVCYMCFIHESSTAMLGVLGGYLYVGFRVMPGLNRIFTQLGLLRGSLPAIEVVLKEFSYFVRADHSQDIPDFTFKESLALKNVSFHYHNSTHDVVDNVSLTLQKGECLGIVGETGSGKSTLLDLLLGLLKPTSGTIIVDHRFPVRCRQWHACIGYVPQFVYLSDDTLVRNITFGVVDDCIDEAKLARVIEIAQLTKFVAQLPQGIHTRVGETSLRLSGGERQRIAIARALYRDPQMLILDEATSALDSETEAALVTALHATMKDCSMIIVAHRTTTLAYCDRVISLSAQTLASEIV